MITKKLTPKSYLIKYVYRDVPMKKGRKKKIKEGNFKILSYHEYDKLLEINYNVSQLKKICKYYKLKISGNKPEKIHRIYNYLKYSNYVIKIQKLFRGNMIRKYLDYKGIKFKKEGISNMIDFLTFENTNKINIDQIFCYKDKDNFVYAFDIRSIHNMLLINKEAKNPYNRNTISIETINKLTNMIHLGEMLKRNMKKDMNNDIENLPKEKRLQLKVIKIFQKMDEFGFVTDSKWFLNLNRHRSIKYVRELIDIWTYRLKIPTDMKKKIIPPHGNPFIDIHINNLGIYNNYKLKRTIIKIMERFITTGLDKDAKYLGCQYVLGALTIVSNSAAIALPWVYESFRHQD